MFTKEFSLSTAFKNAGGLKIGNAVRFSGINVGEVDNIEIINDTTVKVDIKLKSDIKQFIKKDINPKMTIVVTSDKDIINYITRRGAKNITSEKFSDIVTSTLEEFREEKELEAQEEDSTAPTFDTEESD